MLQAPTMLERLDQIERNLLRLAVFLAPMRELRPTAINFTYSDLVFCLVAGMMLVRRRIPMAPMHDVTVIWMVANFCLIGGLFASSIINGVASASLVVGIQYIFAYVVLPFVVLRDEETAMDLVKALMYGGLVVVICGFGFMAAGYDGGFVYISGTGRLASLASNPNEFAIMIALSVQFLLYLWFSKALPSVICLIALTCFFIGLILASSNSGIVATTIGMAAFLLFSGSLRTMITGVLFASLLVVMAATVGYEYLPDVFQRRVLSAVESGSMDNAGTYSGRVELIDEALQELEGTIFLGIGADQYRERSYIGEVVHNQYLLVWIEGGLIALFGWLLILATMVFIGIRCYQQRDGARQAALVLATTIIIIIIGNTSPHLYARSWVMPLLVAIGVPLSRQVTAMSAPKPPAETKQKSLPHRPGMHAQIRYSRRR